MEKNLGRKTLVLLGALGLFSPVILQSLAVVLILVPLSVILVVYIALFNQKVLDRLVKLITAIPSLWREQPLTKKN